MVDNTFIGAGPSVSDDPTVWSLGHAPITGENIKMVTETSANNLSWNYAITDLGSISLSGASAGGTVAQSANVGAAGAWSNAQWIWQTSTKTLTAGDGTLGAAGQLQQTGTGGNVTCTSYLQDGTGSVLNSPIGTTFTCSGNITHTAGIAYIENLVINAPATITGFNNHYVGSLIINLIANANVILAGGQVDIFGYITLHNANISGVTLFTYPNFSSGSLIWTGTGTISCPISLLLYGVISVTIGDIHITGAITAACAWGSSYLSYLSMLSDILLANLICSNIGVDLNGHALICNLCSVSGTYNTPSISSSVPGARLSCAGLTVAANGSFDRTNFSQINANGNIDMSAGTSADGTETWILGKNGQTVKLAAGQDLYNVIDMERMKLLSDVPIANLYAHNNPADLNGFAIVHAKPGNEFTGLRRAFVKPMVQIPIGPVGLAQQWFADLGGYL